MIDWRIYDSEKLGNILVDEGKLLSANLQEALEIVSHHGKKIIDVLVEYNFISEEELVEFLASKLDMDIVNVAEIEIEDQVIESISKEIANKYNIIPFKEEEHTIFIAMGDPTNLLAIDDVKFITGKTVSAYICKGKIVQKAVDRYYNNENSNTVLEELREEYEGEEEDNTEEEDLLALIENAPAVRLANSILTQAIGLKASDIHIEPFENEVVVRYRIDGALGQIMTIPTKLYPAVCTRIKIMAEMDIAEKRIPQDGRIEMKMGKTPYDFRVSTLPTVFGEKIVMRILDRSAFSVDREKLGFAEEENKIIDKILSMPHGILLVTGPTGSGKTTTLYSFLKEINKPDRNITTIEDPAEYRLDRINQVQVNVKSGLTFAAGLRSMLRQDPDIIMIGEIRDEETAQIAVKASITGHFVLSTLHTNDAPSTVTRLMDMGIEPYLVADAMVGVIAQRLIRKLCPECKEMYEPKEWERKILNTDTITTLYQGKGCIKCNGTGYKGRMGIHEVLYVNQDVREAIEANAGADKIREAAVKNGMTTLFESCQRLVEKGETSLSEMVKVVYERE